MDLRIGRRGRAFEKIEIAALVGLCDVLLVERTEAALELGLGSLPRGAAARELVVADLELQPARGHIELDHVVFRYPVDIQQTFVKRCIGVPGDRIKLIDKKLILNGHEVKEPYVYNKTEYIDSYRDNFPSEPNVRVVDSASDMLNNHVVNGEVVVPPGYYFAMGDNRDSSLDSRYWGFVPAGNIIGKPLIIYWSYDAPTEALSKPMISVDHLLDLVQHFPSKTRWRRTFNLIHGYPLK